MLRDNTDSDNLCPQNSHLAHLSFNRSIECYKTRINTGTIGPTLICGELKGKKLLIRAGLSVCPAYKSRKTVFERS